MKKAKQVTARRGADYDVESAVGWATTRWRAGRGQRERLIGGGSTAEAGEVTATDEPAGGHPSKSHGSRARSQAKWS